MIIELTPIKKLSKKKKKKNYLFYGAVAGVYLTPLIYPAKSSVLA